MSFIEYDTDPNDTIPIFSRFDFGMESLLKLKKYHRRIYILGLSFTFFIIFLVVARILYASNIDSSTGTIYLSFTSNSQPNTEAQAQEVRERSSRTLSIYNELYSNANSMNSKIQNIALDTFVDKDLTSATTEINSLRESIIKVQKNINNLTDYSEESADFYLEETYNVEMISAILNLGLFTSKIHDFYEKIAGKYPKSESNFDSTQLSYISDKTKNISEESSSLLSSLTSKIQDINIEFSRKTSVRTDRNSNSFMGEAIAEILLAFMITALAIYAIQIAVNFTRYHGKMSDLISSQISAAEFSGNNTTVFYNTIRALRPTADFGKMPKSMYEELLELLKENLKKSS